ncbi:hypothetical protein D9M70_570770 [compost metagenome]
MLLMTMSLSDSLRIVTRCSVSRNVQVPPEPTIVSESKTTSPGPGLTMSLTTMSALWIVSPSPSLLPPPLALSLTVTSTATSICPSAPMTSCLTTSSGERPERMRTSELKSICCGRSSGLLPSEPPAASERLLWSASSVCEIEPLTVEA